MSLSGTPFSRMKLDFETFVDTSLTSNSSLDTTRFNLNLPSQSNTKTQTEREKDAEIAVLKAAISERETHLQKVETLRRQEKIEFEKKLQDVKNEFQRKLDRFGESRQQQQVLRNKEEDLREELRDTKRELDAVKAASVTLQKEKLTLMQKLSEVEHSLGRKAEELQSQNVRLETDLIHSTKELENVTEQLSSTQAQISSYHRELKSLEEHKMKALSAHLKVKELEQKLSRVEEDAVVTKAMRSYVTQYPELEKENIKLKEEIQNYKEREENIFLLKEQLRGTAAKLERAEQKVIWFDQLKTQAEVLQGKLKEYEFVDQQGKVKTLHPDEMKQRISSLQVENATMKDTLGQRLAAIHSLENKLQEREKQIQQLRVSSQQEQFSAQNNTEHIKKMRRKILLLAKERDSLKQVLDSYESEMTVSVGQVTNQRVRQLEDIVETYQHQMASLEQEVELKTQQLTEAQSRTAVLEGELKSSGKVQTVPVSSQVDQDLILSLRKQLSELQTQYDKTLESKEILEARIEQRHMQGEYDPMETKVVHFRMNPAALSQQHRALELSKLKEENERLRERVKLLQDAASAGAASHAVDDLTAKVEENLLQPSTSKETEELKTELEKAKLQNKRLKEVFTKTSRDVREILCFQILGYKIDIPGTNKYRLMNMYAESPDDYLLFQQTAEGEVHMMENEYTATLSDKIDTYLNTYHSIPAFLSALTLDLFQKQTMCVS